MTFRNDISFKTTLFDNIEKDMNALPQVYQTRFNKETRKPIRNVRKRLRRPPARKPTLPFVWSFNKVKQGKARRWWFAAIAGRIPGVTIETSGGRYKRSGNLLKGLKIKFNRAARTITAAFGGSGIRYVMGDRQVPSHKRTGWKRIDKELDQAAAEINDVGLRVWDEITDEVGS